jgi:protein involved in polysaccharide export with SLBB domain
MLPRLLTVLIQAALVQVVLAQNVNIPVNTSHRSISSTDETVLELADRNSYVLGPGDMITVVIAGGSSQYLLAAGVPPWAEYTVGGDGYLSVAGIGSVDVDGLTIEAAQLELQRTASYYYPTIRVTLSLQEPRKLRVSLGGMVNMPGTYVLSALDRVSDALELGGGISTFGSRRGVMITESGDSLEIDLNMLPGTATFVSDPFLRNNADVMIDICDEPVYILSALGSIETRDIGREEDVETLLDRMGGVPGNMDLRSSRILRRGENHPVWTDDEGFNPMYLQTGDTILVVSIRDSIIVGGAVNLPGQVPYSPENTVGDYILCAGGPQSTSGGEIVIFRNGQRFDPEEDLDTFKPLPGDAIQLNYSWFERNDTMIGLVTSVISLGITLYAVSTR